MTERVLIVEDDIALGGVIAGYLRRAGFEVEAATDGSEGLALAHTWYPALVILDLMLPGISGLEVLRRLRDSGSDVLVLVLSALGAEDNRVVGLERGADDYVAKPFSPRELVLRVGGLLRRQAHSSRMSPTAQVIEIANLTIDMEARTAYRDEERIALSCREFDLLAFLASHPGAVFSKEDLLRCVWGWDFGDTSTVTVHVRRLRQKIESDPSTPRLLATVWGVGYRFEIPPPADPRRPSADGSRR